MRHKLSIIGIALICFWQAACGCFCYSGARWGVTPTVPFYFAPALFPPNFESEYTQASQTWTLASLGTFRFVNAGQTQAGFSGTPDGINAVDFIYLGFLPDNPIAITVIIDASFYDCVIREVDVAFNSVPPNGSYDTSGIPQVGRYDIRSVALHEQGHYLQLAHVGCPDDSIMLPSYRQISQNFTRVKRNLDGCDIVGINAIYLAQAPPCLPLGGFCFFSFILPFITAEGDQVALDSELSAIVQANQDEVIQIASSDPVIIEEATSLALKYQPLLEQWLKDGSTVSEQKVTDEDVKKAECVLQRLHANGSRQLRDDVDKVKKRIKDLKGRSVSELFGTSLTIYKAPKPKKEIK